MKKELVILSAPTILLAGVGFWFWFWFWFFPKNVNRELEGPFREILIFQKSAPLTKQEKFERYDTKVSFRFDMRGTPDLPSGFSYMRSRYGNGPKVVYSLAAQNYRFVTEINGVKKAYAQNHLGVFQNFAWHSGDFFQGTISAKNYRAPRNSKNFIAFDLVALSYNTGVNPKLFLGVYALDLQTKKLQLWS